LWSGRELSDAVEQLEGAGLVVPSSSGAGRSVAGLPRVTQLGTLLVTRISRPGCWSRTGSVVRGPRLLVEGGRGYLCPALFPRKSQA
jgi:hypothetical protein